METGQPTASASHAGPAPPGGPWHPKYSLKARIGRWAARSPPSADPAMSGLGPHPCRPPRSTCRACRAAQPAILSPPPPAAAPGPEGPGPCSPTPAQSGGTWGQGSALLGGWPPPAPATHARTHGHPRRCVDSKPTRRSSLFPEPRPSGAQAGRTKPLQLGAPRDPPHRRSAPKYCSEKRGEGQGLPAHRVESACDSLRPGRLGC